MQKKRHVVALIITPGIPIFEVAVPCEVFGVQRPDLVDPWYDLRICAPEPGATIAGGFAATSAFGLDEAEHADTVIVPACENVHARQNDDVVAAVRAAHRNGARIAAICSGAFVLAQAGLLDGRRATTHWMYAESLQRRYPDIRLDPAVLYTNEGGIHTSAGTAAAIDLCIDLVRQDHGTAIANALARRMVTPAHRAHDQAQYVRAPIAADGAAPLGAITEWALEHLGEPIRIRDLAHQAHLSERQLSRRFLEAFGRTPGDWLVNERLRKAQELLERTSFTVDAIASGCGFGTGAGLRAAFAKHLRTSPSEYRAIWAA